MKRIFFILAALVATAGSALATGITGTTTGTTRLGGNIASGVETRLEDLATQLNDEATRQGDATFANRFATDFGVTTDVLATQRTQFSADWGDLFLAYTIMDASRTSVTLDEIFAMRSTGQSWVSIARSLRIPPGTLLRSLRTSTVSGSTTRSGNGGLSSRGSGSTSGNRTGMTAGGVNRQIDTRLQTLDEQLSSRADTDIAGQLAQQLGVTSDVLLQQRTQFGADWGDLLVAYTIQDRATTSVTIDQIFQLRSAGESWTQIAHAYRVPVGQLVRGIRAETQMLSGATTTTTTTSGSGTLLGKSGTARARIQAMKAARAGRTTTTAAGTTTLSTGALRTGTAATSARLSTSSTLLRMRAAALMRATGRAGHK